MRRSPTGPRSVATSSRAQWDAACRRIVRAPFDELADRPAVTLSGGERKQLVLDVLFASDADVLLLDEPDNFLDVPAKLALERRIRDVQEDRADDLPRSRGPGRCGRLDRDARGQRRLGARRLVRDLRAGPGGAPAPAGRRCQALARRGAAAVPADEDVQGARQVLERLGQEGRRRRDALAPVQGRRAAPGAGRRSPRSWSGCAAATPPGGCSTCGRSASPALSRRSPTRSTSASGSA